VAKQKFLFKCAEDNFRLENFTAFWYEFHYNTFIWVFLKMSLQMCSWWCF